MASAVTVVASVPAPTAAAVRPANLAAMLVMGVTPTAWPVVTAGITDNKETGLAAVMVTLAPVFSLK